LLVADEVPAAFDGSGPVCPALIHLRLETERAWPHIASMAEKRPPRPSDEQAKAKALDDWTDEGGAIAPAKPPKRPRDLFQWAKRMVDIATGEVEDKPPVKSAARGGVARAEALSPKRRAEIARVAAEARWKKRD